MISGDGGGPREGRRGVASAELIAVEDGSAAVVEDGEIEGLGVRDGAELEGVGGVTGSERKIGGAVGESSGALIAQQRGRVAEQDEVEIVIVVVIDPDGGLEAALREVGGRELEAALDVAVEQRTGSRSGRRGP